MADYSPTCNGSGVLTIPGRELAAYVGDEACRYLLGYCTGCHGLHRHEDRAKKCARSKLGKWVQGLSRYGDEVLRRTELVLDGIYDPEPFEPFGASGAGLGERLARYARLISADVKTGEPVIRQAIQDDLVPWAIGARPRRAVEELDVTLDPETLSALRDYANA